ncbi:hypothetical protein [uncultured Vagococcus sp.]|uniref:hypothetical protein n=1 Tax=uncultured Vagococcus sp. TaxID=189676 RepID=UPI0028D6FBC4|nr:hypothetical protein [uncultured Vagococcus sp.]
MKKIDFVRVFFFVVGISFLIYAFTMCQKNGMIYIILSLLTSLVCFVMSLIHYDSD